MVSTYPTENICHCLNSIFLDPYTASGAYVELKTMRFDGQKKHSWDRKALKWFLQSYLTATKEIVVGLRDDSGYLFANYIS